MMFSRFVLRYHGAFRAPCFSRKGRLVVASSRLGYAAPMSSTALAHSENQVLNLEATKPIRRADLVSEEEPSIVTPYREAATSVSLQTALMHVVDLVSGMATAARAMGVAAAELKAANVWTLRALASSMSTVHRDNKEIADMIRQGSLIEEDLAVVIASYGCPSRAGCGPRETLDLSEKTDNQLVAFGTILGVQDLENKLEYGHLASLKDLVGHGLKGGSAFEQRLRHLDPTKDDDEVMASIHDIFHQLPQLAEAKRVNELIVRVGRLNLRALADLDKAKISHFGEPQPTAIQVYSKIPSQKSVLVSGHDMVALHKVLKNTAATDIKVFTHGRLLAAHSYPTINSFPHLAGNYESETSEFPGSVVMAKGNHFDTRSSINSELSILLERCNAVEAGPALFEPLPVSRTTGHHHTNLKSLVSETAEAIQSGDVDQVIMLLGNGESEHDRKYHHSLVESASPRSVILAASSAAKNSETTVPHVLHDSYSGMVFLEALAKECGRSVKDLPVSVATTHADEEDTALLLALLGLGLQNIQTGPIQPSYVTPKMIDYLSNEFHVSTSTGEPKEDMAAM